MKPTPAIEPALENRPTPSPTPTPTIELTADRAYLRLNHHGIFAPLVFEWPNYPEAFAKYMNELHKGRVEVKGLRQVTG